MATSAVYVPHSITLPSGGPVVQLSDITAARNYQDLVERAASEAGPQWSGSEYSAPDLRCTSKQIAEFIALCTTEGVAADLSAGNADFYFRKVAARGTRVAIGTAVHVRGRLASNALLFWESIRASQNQAAELVARFICSQIGTTAPIQIEGTQAAVGASDVDELFTLGPIAFTGTAAGSVTVEALQEVTYESGVQVLQEYDAGSPHPSFVAVDTHACTCTFKTRQTTLLATIPNDGDVLTAFTGYLRARKKGGINVADATASHIKVSATAGTIKAREAAGLKGIVEVFVQFHKPDLATNELVWATGQAIT